MRQGLRWLATGMVLAAVATTGVFSTRRVVGSLARVQADDFFEMGDLETSLDYYERSRRWDPSASTAQTDTADTIAYALAYSTGGLQDNPERAPDLAARSLELYLRSVAEAVPNSWSWGGISSLYEYLRNYRPFLEEIDLSTLGTVPLENARPEDRLAEAALLLALRFEPQNYFYLDSLGELYWSRGLRDEALGPFRRAVEIYPVLDGHFYIKDRVGESADLADAIQEGLARSAETVPLHERWVVRRERGQLARLRGRFEQAGEHFRLAVADAEAAPALHRATLLGYLADMEIKVGNEAAAVEHLRQASELQPERWQVHGTLGQLLGKMGRHEESMAALGRARAMVPANPSIYGAIARESIRAGDVASAEKAYQEIIRLQPDRADGYLQVIDLLRHHGAYARAIPYARDLVRKQPDEPLFKLQLEQLYEQESR